MKKLLFTTATLVSTIVPAATIVSCGSKKGFDPIQKDSAIMLVGAAGHSDKGFLQGGYDGAQQAIKDISNFKKYSEIKLPGSGIPDAKKGTNKALQAGAYIVLGIGYQYPTFFNTKEYADKYKDRQFIAIDGPVNGVTNDKLKENVIAIDFKAEQSAFQAAVATGIYLAKNYSTYSEEGGLKVGAFGGAGYPPIKGMIYGFMKGIAYYNDNLAKDDAHKVEFIGWNGAGNGFTGGFVPDSTSAAKSNVLLGKKPDVVFPVAGGQVSSMVDAIKADSARKNIIKVVGVDSDQTQVFGDDGKYFITSAMKNTKIAVERAIKTIYGAKNLGLTKSKNNFVGLNGGYVKLAKGQINKSDNLKGSDLQSVLKTGQKIIANTSMTLYEQLSTATNDIYIKALLIKPDWDKIKDEFGHNGNKKLTLTDFNS